MSKLKSKNEFKERDEIEEYFSEVKNRSFPFGIIPIFLLLLIIGGISYYYFIIDNPKNIFLTLINNTIQNLETNYHHKDRINYELNLDTNIETTNKKYIDTVNTINDLAISASGGIDLNEHKIYTDIKTFYKQSDLIELSTYYQSDKNIYLKSEDIFDKVLKLSLESKNTDQINKDYNVNKNNLNDLYTSFIDVLKPLLNQSEYKKEYLKLNNSIAKKITLIINKQFKETFYNNLLDNKDFINSFSKLQGISKEKLKETINKEIDNLNNNEETISLYLSILENKFISLEIDSEQDRLVLNKEDNKYSYKIYNDKIIEYQGYLELNKTNNDYEINISYEDIEKNLDINLNLDLTLEYNKEINTLDTKNAIDYKTLSESDIKKINKNINNNQNLINLITNIQEITK